ncbi:MULTISPECIES: type IV pilin [Haloarcula]|uniref:Archaeal Type IV pilin N-terminal domain-containing protein n=1 Tax=Haloarcula pellucida TaxID=1427151 RepID=A0A830GS37_9EURY|nr:MULTISPECIES: type IV pilin [Halomicroarcula]MBX0349550.1 type IV pilin [Halomicroarcula pellucida]MDS0278863.1 type IV pilin [Halomicroarcula sp. S1AR25-4]GGO02417.1 hypothetical protein GCM10009030_36920 [Halomicroarcula pellucida]
MPARAQSPLIGNLLIVAVAVVLLATLSVGVFTYTSMLGDEPPSVSIDTSVSATSVELVHASGESIPVDESSVVFDFPDTQLEVPLSVLALETGTDDGEFTAGEVYRYPHGVEDGTVEVRLVHDPSGAVVDELERRVTSGENVLADFESRSLSNYAGGQSSSGSASVSDGGRTVTLTGSQWKYIDYPYEMTGQTMLTFEFRSDAQGDIHGIGLTRTTSQAPNRVVRVYGTQNWGSNVSTATSEPYYDGSGEWVRYEIPLGQLYQIDADYLVVVMDCDATTAVASGTDDGRCVSRDGNTPTATSYFRNIQIEEADG